MCWRSSTHLSLPWPSSRGRLLVRRSAPGWILRSSHPLLLVGVLLLLRFAVEPPLWPPPLLLSPLSALSTLLPWPVTPLPPLHPRPRLVPRVQHPWPLPCLMLWLSRPSWPVAALLLPPGPPPPGPLNPPLSRGRRPNALPPPFLPLCALGLVPVAFRGSRLPVPCVPVAQRAGPLAGSTSLGTSPLSGSFPMPFPPRLPPLSFRPPSCPRLRSRSRPATTVRGIL